MFEGGCFFCFGDDFLGPVSAVLVVQQILKWCFLTHDKNAFYYSGEKPWHGPHLKYLWSFMIIYGDQMLTLRQTIIGLLRGGFQGEGFP